MPRTSSAGSRAAAGFSLLELLVALSLVVLLFRIESPRLNGVAERQRLAASVRDVVSLLRVARAQALATQKDTAVSVDLLRHEYRMEGQSARFSFPADTVITMTTARSEVAQAEAGSFRFYPDGSTTGGRLTLRSAGVAYDINLFWLTGHVSVAVR